MINLLLAAVLTGFAFNNQSVFAAVQDSQRQEHERQCKLHELLANASYVEIEYTGNARIPSSALFEQMKLTRKPHSTGHFALSNFGSLDHLLDDLERVRFFLGRQGFLEAKTSTPKIEDLGDRVKITVDVREGPRYWIGEVRVKNAKAFTPGQIVEMSGLKPGAVIDAGLIQEKIFQGIKDAYADEGYIQASVDFLPRFRPPSPNSPEGVVDVTLEVDEGRQFFIESIGFPGLVKTDAQIIRDLLSIKEGDRYSRKTLHEALRVINQLEMFEEIREKDVIIRTNVGGSTIALDFQLKEKNK